MSLPGSPSWIDDLAVYAHIGDRHIGDRSMQNYRDFLAIVADIEAIRRDIIDFVYLPGDNADSGSDEQYRLVATGLRMLGLPAHAITGDHDMETGSLEPFYRTRNARTLPHTLSVGRVDRVFLDMSGEGEGGPNFRLPSHQTSYLKTAIDAAREGRRRVVVLMHTHPSDLGEHSEQAIINPLLADATVRLVDMGHTHYNELANDGGTNRNGRKW